MNAKFTSVRLRNSAGQVFFIRKDIAEKILQNSNDKKYWRLDVSEKEYVFIDGELKKAEKKQTKKKDAVGEPHNGETE